MADLTPEDVFAACEAIAAVRVSDANSINGHQVWKALGRGSKSTVQKHVSRWHRMRNGDDDSTVSVANLMAGIEQAITRLVENSVSGERDLNRIRAAKDAERMKSLSDTLIDMQVEKRDLTARLDLTRAKHAEDLANILALKETVSRLEGKLELAEKQAAVAADQLGKWAAEGLPEAVRAHAGGQYLATLLTPRKGKPPADST